MVHLAERPKRASKRPKTQDPAAPARHSSGKSSHPAISPLAMRSPHIQPKLTVNQPGDKYEQEADAVATAVMHTPAPLPQPDDSRGSIQRLAMAEEPVQRVEEEDQDVLQRVATEEEPVQRVATEEEPIQRKGAGSPRVSASTAATIRSPGSGSPLPASARHRIEPHVGANLSGVRVHNDASAHRATSSLQARAFTHGNHIFLNRSESSHNLGLMAHEATHVVQQGAAPIQRQPLPAPDTAVQRVPIPGSKPPEVQRLIPDFILEELSDYARYIPGYTLFTVIIGYDPLREEDVPLTPINLLEGLMGLVPFGTVIFDALQEYGVIQAAFDWISDQLNRLDLSLARIERIVDAIWDEVGVTGIARGFDYVIGVVRRHFQALYDDVVAFATSLVSHIIELIKEAVIDFAEPLLAENRAWALIKKILHYDPLRDEEVEASTVEILEDFLLLIGKEQELEQMRERGTLQETADWLDTQFGLFVSLIGQLRGLITAAWNAIQPENLPDLGTNLVSLAEQVGTFLEGVWEFASSVALKVLELIKHALLGWLSTFANDVPGYHLLTVILEQDPFTQAAVPRNATNLIRGFMSLMPGGEQQFQQMQETGVIPQAAQRIEGMMAELGITWPFVQQLFLDLWNAFTIEDLLSPVDAFIRILEQFSEPLNRLFSFVIEVIKVALELILALMNFPTDLIGSIITNALQALDDIQRDPVGFLINLLNTAKLGFQKFFDNILEHLLGGLTDWLFRAVREAGIEPPADFTFESILGFVLDVLGLTMDHMWELLAEHIGQERVDQIRGAIDRVMEIGREAWGFIQDVQERGMVAVWEYIESQLTNLWDVVLEQVQSYVMERVIVVGMRWLLSLLDATGITPVINSFIAFFNAIQSAIAYLRDMLEVVNDFVSTVASIAAGDIEPGATRMEQGLANSIPIVIGFIANQMGLGNISERLGEIIESIRALVDRALNWLIEQALRLGRNILTSLGIGDNTTETSEPEASDPIDPTDHEAMARRVARELQAVESSTNNYESVRRDKEQQAQQLEEQYTAILEPGIGLFIQFSNRTTDEADNDLDFVIIIRPNTIQYEDQIDFRTDLETFTNWPATIDPSNNIIHRILLNRRMPTGLINRIASIIMVPIPGSQNVPQQLKVVLTSGTENQYERNEHTVYIKSDLLGELQNNRGYEKLTHEFDHAVRLQGSLNLSNDEALTSEVFAFHAQMVAILASKDTYINQTLSQVDTVGDIRRRVRQYSQRLGVTLTEDYFHDNMRGFARTALNELLAYTILMESKGDKSSIRASEGLPSFDHVRRQGLLLGAMEARALVRTILSGS